MYPKCEVGYILPRKITNFLTEGLPSRIYLLCFISPRSGYQLALDTSGKLFTSKIYGWTKKMMGKGYLQRDPYGYRTVIKPLAAELDVKLKEKGENLDFHERQLLSVILGSDGFKAMVSNAYESWKERTPDIVSLTSEYLSTAACLTLNLKRWMREEGVSATQALKMVSGKGEIETFPKEDQSYVQLFNEVFYDHLARMGMKKKDSKQGNDFETMELVEFSIFANLPNDLLAKLSRLGSNTKNLTYTFALVLAVAVMVLKAKLDAFKRQQGS